MVSSLLGLLGLLLLLSCKLFRCRVRTWLPTGQPAETSGKCWAGERDRSWSQGQGQGLGGV